MSDVDSTLFSEKPTKKCAKCKVILPVENFGLVKGKIRSYCKTCHKAHLLVPDLRKEKQCACCKQIKPVGDFNRSGKRYQPYCRSCGESLGAESRAIKKASGESVAVNRRDYKKRKWTRLRTKYGLEKDDYELLIVQQNGCCAICKLTEKEKDGQHGEPLSLSVDHDHVTGSVRGLLCRQCNIGIGRLKESVEILQNAINYLKSHQEK